jgi:hypothetical protein
MTNINESLKAIRELLEPNPRASFGGSCVVSVKAKQAVNDLQAAISSAETDAGKLANRIASSMIAHIPEMTDEDYKNYMGNLRRLATEYYTTAHLAIADKARRDALEEAAEYATYHATGVKNNSRQSDLSNGIRALGEVKS